MKEECTSHYLKFGRIAFIIALLFGTISVSYSQIKYYRKLPSDNSIGFGMSAKYKVEVKDCNGQYKEVYTYGIEPNSTQVTKKEHIAMFGFNPAGGPATIKITLKNGTKLTSSNIGLRNKTYKGVKTSFSGGAMFIEVCQPYKQLMVRMPSDKGNPLMIHVDPHDLPKIPAGANVKVFDGGTNGKIHEQTAQYDRYTVPNDVDVVVIEDGALFKGTIHTKDGRSKPLTVQGYGMIICRNVSKPSNETKMKYNAMELNKGNGHKIYGLTFMNGRHFAIRTTNKTDIKNIKLYGYRANNDGIKTGSDSKIAYSFFKCDDDHIKLYANNIKVNNCVFYEQGNGAIFQFGWNKLNPGDNCVVENIEVLEWEANCGDPAKGEGGIARSFINHREAETTGLHGYDNVFRNIYIQGPISGLVCLNGYKLNPVTHDNLTLENVTLEQPTTKKSWLYASKGSGNTYINLNLKNVRYANRFVEKDDFKTIGKVTINIDNTGNKYTGKMNANEVADCGCDGPIKDCAGIEGGSAFIDDCNECVGGNTGKEACTPAVKDCAGVENGTAYIDDCDECVGGTTGKTPCTVTVITDIKDLAATAPDCKSVQLTWSDVEGESGYRIRRKIDGEATYQNITDVAADVKTYTDNSVAENTTYIYQVRPLDGGTAVAVSNTPKVATPTCTEPIKDCNGDAGGTASIDVCGICTGGNTGIEPSTLPEVTVAKKDETCGNAGSITLTFADAVNRTQIEFSIDGGVTYPVNVKDDSGTYTFADLTSGDYTVFARWGNDECPVDVGTVTLTETGCPEEITQTVTLVKGWNLVSFYVEMPEEAIETILPNAETIKTFDGFYAKGQDTFLNSIQKLESGVGYMIYNSIDEKITLTGLKVTISPFQNLSEGWNLIPAFATDKDLDSITKEFDIIKNFNGFYQKGGEFNSIDVIKKGQAYMLKK